MYYVYITGGARGTLYVGVTNDLKRRVAQHKAGTAEGFTHRYKITRLLYYETTQDVRSAIRREKQLKGWTRRKKLDLIRTMNPEFRDLYLE